jgi:hypothetical protein
MKRLLFVLLALFLGSASARDVDVTWINANPAEVEVTELRWRNPTDWSSTIDLGWADRSYTLEAVSPGVIEFQVRFCTTAEGYDAECSDWVGRAAEVPSQATDVLITYP